MPRKESNFELQLKEANRQFRLLDSFIKKFLKDHPGLIEMVVLDSIVLKDQEAEAIFQQEFKKFLEEKDGKELEP